jgi:hypothetical protein
MSSVFENRYFIAAGQSLADAEKWDEACVRARAATLALLTELGVTKGAWEPGYGLCSVFFGDAKPPKGWVRAQGSERGHYVPSSKKNDEAKKWRRRMEECEVGMPSPGSCHVNGLVWHRPGIEKIGGKWVIVQHRDAKPPADAVEIKASEYVAMKEDRR